MDFSRVLLYYFAQNIERKKYKHSTLRRKKHEKERERALAVLVYLQCVILHLCRSILDFMTILFRCEHFGMNFDMICKMRMNEMEIRYEFFFVLSKA